MEQAMSEHLPVYVGADALARLVAFCSERDLRRLALVADPNTYEALGRRAEEALRAAGCEVRTIVLQRHDIGADAQSVYQVLLALDNERYTFVSAGSGTVTDVARFVSHRSNTGFIALPTAASVDGYTSIGAPMIVDGAKVTESAHGPLAVFADLPTLCAAPRSLTAAGFGDLIAKLTSVSDWEIGHLVWDEPFDAEIARRARQAVWDSVDTLDALAAAECDGIEALFDGLIESGFCMLDFGETRPASGYEHHISHFWEMLLLREGRHSVFHGAKVGVGVLASARVYDRLRALSAEEAAQRAARAALPDRSTDEAAIRAAYRQQAEAVINGHAPFLAMTPEQFDGIKQRVVDRWTEIQAAVALVPGEAEMRGWLERLGGATTASDISISQEEYDLGLNIGHFYRPRFTGKKLARLLGL
jgi:glycerol-1-phosphate dehydrogenase [NAD(P)+]